MTENYKMYMYIDDKENRKMCPSKIESNSLSILESTTETKVSWIKVLLRYRANFSFKLGRKKLQFVLHISQS